MAGQLVPGTFRAKRDPLRLADRSITAETARGGGAGVADGVEYGGQLHAASVAEDGVFLHAGDAGFGGRGVGVREYVDFGPGVFAWEAEDEGV